MAQPAAILFLLIIPCQPAELVTKDQLANYLKTTGTAAAKVKWGDESRRLTAKLTAAKRGLVGKNRPMPGTPCTPPGGGFLPSDYSFMFETAADKRKTVADIEEALKEARTQYAKPSPLLPRLPAYRMRVGDVGELFCPVPIGRDDMEAHAMRIIQVLGEDSLLVQMGVDIDFRAEFVLRIPTAGLVDGKFILANAECYEVRGTVTHGRKTLLEVKPFNVKAFLANEAK